MSGQRARSTLGSNVPLYERDFYAWANEQAGLLRSGRIGEADIANIAEEIESMGRSERKELVSRLSILLAHLLKWQFQPEKRGRSWELTVVEQRIQLDQHLRDNPSLKYHLDDAVADAYRTARIMAARESDLPPATFPESCPWRYTEAIREDWLPSDETQADRNRS